MASLVSQTLIVLQALLLGAVILGAEWRRPIPRRAVDFFRVTSVVYFICFVVLPLYLQIDDQSDVRGTAWGWLLKQPFDGTGFAYAGTLSLIGYGAVLLGFHLAGGDGPGQLRLVPVGPVEPLRGRDTASLLAVSMALGVTGLACLTVYTASIGGVGVLVLQAAAFRLSEPPVITPFAFLKTLSPMVMAGMFLLHGLRSREHLAGRPRRWTIAYVTFLVGSLLILIHQAGRFPLAMFLLTFPLATVIRSGRIRMRAVLAGTALVFLFLLFGKQLFESTLMGTNLTDRIASVGQDLRSSVTMVLREFAFPSVTAANATLEVPGEIDFRWFYDFPLALQYLLPQRLLGVAHPLTVSMVNTTRFPAFGTIPVDLVSLGYFSAGVPGVALLLTMFGALIAWCERLLPATTDPVDCVLRSAWILFISVRVMYGDPQLIWPGGLHLIILSILLLLVRILAERRPPTRPPVLFPSIP